MPGSVAIASESRFANARTSRSFHVNDCSPSSATGTIGSSVKPVLVCTVKTIARATYGNGGEDLVSATLIDWTFETGMSQSRLDLRHPMKATLPDSTATTNASGMRGPPKDSTACTVVGNRIARTAAPAGKRVIKSDTLGY